MGAGVKAAEHAPTLLLQVSTSLCRVWITLIKLSYALIQECLLRPNMQHHESLCGRLLPSALRVSEKNSSRKPGDQAHLPTPRYRKVYGWMNTGFREQPFAALQELSQRGRSPTR